MILIISYGNPIVKVLLLHYTRLEKTITTYIGNSSQEVEKVSYTNDIVWTNKSQTVGFKGIKKPIWAFQIGGYQVCEKWLKDRKGRKLSKDDIAHYQKIVVAISETIRIMAEIDKAINHHGGWPGAFK